MTNANLNEGIRTFDVTNHAVSRAVERLGVAREYAANHVIQLMQSAYYQGMTPGPRGITKIFDHHKSETRIITDELAETIITVYKFPELPKVVGEYLSPIINRELRKARRLHTRTVRALELEKAHEMTILAEMAMNYANARNPKTRGLIAGRMNEVRKRMSVIDDNITESNEVYAKMRRDLGAYVVPEDVTTY